MTGGRALFFCPKSKMTFGTDFSGTPCIFLLVLTIIPIGALLKTKKHDSSTNIRCTGPPGPPVCGGNPGNRQQGVRDSISIRQSSMVGERARSGAPLASGGIQAVRFQVDATAERPAGLGPWLPYSESKPAARARGGHP